MATLFHIRKNVSKRGKWKFESIVAEFGRLAMWTLYVKSLSIIKHLTYNGKQIIWVIGLTQEGYPFMWGLKSLPTWFGV